MGPLMTKCHSRMLLGLRQPCERCVRARIRRCAREAVEGSVRVVVSHLGSASMSGSGSLASRAYSFCRRMRHGLDAMTMGEEGTGWAPERRAWVVCEL